MIVTIITDIIILYAQMVTEMRLGESDLWLTN